MIRMCKQKKIDLILTKSISRFARNTVDCLEYVRILKELGIGVIFEKENINTLTMTSEFMIALYGSFAQAESESIWRHPEDGVAQRERLRQERIAAREQEQRNEPPCDERVEPVSEVREEVGETPDENLEAAVSDCDDFEETEDEGMAMSM